MILDIGRNDISFSRSRREPDLIISRAPMPLLTSGHVDYGWWPDADGEGFDLRSDLGWLPVPAGQKPDAGLHTLPAPNADAVFGMEPSRPFEWHGRRYRWEVRPRWTIRDVTAFA